MIYRPMSSGVLRALSWPVVNLKTLQKNIVDDKNICFHCISCSQPSALGINQLTPVCLEKNVAFQSINVNTVLLISDDNVPLLCRLVLAEREDLSASG